MESRVEHSRWRSLGPALVAAFAFLLHAACGGQYGIFRDELYFLVCGQRLDWGYVDQPPGIAAVAAVAHALFDTWVPGLRSFAWLAHAATVFLAGRLAVRLGGGAFSATLAAIATVCAPLLLALGHYLTMNAFEPLLMAAFALVLLKLVDGGDPRAWLAAAALAAVAVLFKYTSVLLSGALLIGVLTTGARRALLTRWTLIGAALALLLVLPNFLWQAQHGFPFLELVRNGQLYKNAPLSLPQFVKSLVVELNPLLAPLWLGGLVALLVSRRSRFLGLGAALFVAALAASRGKPYYVIAAMPLLFAGGAVAVERLLRHAIPRVALAAAVVASGLALAPVALPLLSEEGFVAYSAALGLQPTKLERNAQGELPQVYADQHGWPELARVVAGVFQSLPEAEQQTAAVFAQNYGEAAAIDVYGDELGLPAAASGHNNYFLWGVPTGRGDPMIVISDEHEDCAGGLYRERTLAARVPPNPWVMPYEDQLHLWICRGLSGSLEPALRSARHYE